MAIKSLNLKKKLLLFAFTWILSNLGMAQVDPARDWFYSFGADGSIKIGHPNYKEKATFLIQVIINDSMYSYKTNWFEKEQVLDVSLTDLGLEDAVASYKGAVQRAKYIVFVDSQEVFKREIYFSVKPKNELVICEFLPDEINSGGDVIDGVFYWNDIGGHHYIVQSKNGSGSGIYLDFFTIELNGSILHNEVYKNELDCGPRLLRIQEHFQNIQLKDVDKDGFMECYVAIKDECMENDDEGKAYQYFFACSKPFKKMYIHGTPGSIDADQSNGLNEHSEIKNQLFKFRGELAPNN